MTRTINTCVVSDYNCLAPAGWGVSGYGSAANTSDSCGQTRCYVCGESVCTECSNRVSWYGKSVRACTNCVWIGED